MITNKSTKTNIGADNMGTIRKIGEYTDADRHTERYKDSEIRKADMEE